jgi:hypothetical protein
MNFSARKCQAPRSPYETRTRRDIRIWCDVISTFTWLDYSEHERRQFDEIIKGFNEKDTRDELGLGSVRDAFAEMLFPGISTIQTRARYFLFIPWVYQEVERRHERPSATSARNREVALISHLARSSDTEGVIGIDARATLKRLPSSVYWQGLGAWGIRLFPGSQDQYHRLLDAGSTDSHRMPVTDDGDVLDGDIWRRWHGGIPPAPKGFPKGASFILTLREAQFLRERIVSQRPGTMLAFLVDRGRPHEPLSFPWEHPQLGEMPASIQERLKHARNFSESMFGASLLYNLMLAQKAGITARTDLYREELQGWAELVEPRRGELSRWHDSLSHFWRIATSSGAVIPVGARRFVEAWLDCALAFGNTGRIADVEPARQFVHDRERSLKRSLARLDNQRALELWTGAAGAYAHNFRWPAAQRLVRDILAGLAQEDGYAGA